MSLQLSQLADIGNITLAISKNDLTEFAEYLLAQARRDAAIETAKREKEEETLTSEEVCEILKVDKSTLWRWNKTGYLTKCSVGRRSIYRRSDIDALLNF